MGRCHEQTTEAGVEVSLTKVAQGPGRSHAHGTKFGQFSAKLPAPHLWNYRTISKLVAVPDTRIPHRLAGAYRWMHVSHSPSLIHPHRPVSIGPPGFAARGSRRGQGADSVQQSALPGRLGIIV
jgi:hypothetical protein